MSHHYLAQGPQQWAQGGIHRLTIASSALRQLVVGPVAMKTMAAVAFVLTILTALVKYVKSNPAARSWVISLLMTRASFNDRVLRNHFRTMRLSRPLRKGGLHPEDAGARTAANGFIRKFATYFGAEMFSYSMSHADQRDGLRGTRHYHGLKDLAYRYQNDCPRDNDFIKLIDVDYYGNVLHQAMSQAKPILIYTFTPTAAGRSGGAHSYYFSEDGCVNQTFGLDRYTHRLWNYQAGSITNAPILKAGGWCNPRNWIRAFDRITVFNLESRATAQDRSIVLLAPVVTARRPFLWLLGEDYMRSTPMRYLEPIHSIRTEGVDRKVVLFNVSGPDGWTTVVGMPDQPVSISMPIGKFIHLDNFVGVEKTISYPTLRNELSRLGLGQDADHMAGPLIKALGGSLVPDRIYWNYAVDYTWEGERDWRCEKSRPALLARAPAIGPVLPHVPMRNSTNLNSAYIERTEKVRNPNAASPPSDFVYQCMVDFVDRLVGPRKHSIHPEDFDNIIHRIKPKKREAFMEAARHIIFSVRNKVTRFMKRESYGAFKAPRDIRDFPVEDRPGQACIIYALESFLKDSHFYIFGKKPNEVEEAVVAFLSKLVEIDENDFSKYDGTHGQPSRTLELLFLFAAFHPRYHYDLEAWHSTFYKRSMKGGIQSLYERLSGGFDTSLFNTLCAAFVDYLALRHSGMTPSLAWDNVGLHGGDDSLQRVVPQSSFDWSNRQMGFKAKQKKRLRGQPVSFLGRYYGPACWYGTPTSVIDVPRLMTKFHMSVQDASVNVETVFTEKALSLLATDPSHPVLKCFARRILELAGSVDAEIDLGKDGGDYSYTAIRAAGSPGFSVAKGDDCSWLFEAVDPDQVDWLREFNSSVLDPGVQNTLQEYFQALSDKVCILPVELDTPGITAKPHMGDTEVKTSRPQPNTGDDHIIQPTDRSGTAAVSGPKQQTNRPRTDKSKRTTKPRNDNQKSVLRQTVHKRTSKEGTGKALAAASKIRTNAKTPGVHGPSSS
jgi:hypothetical protein